MRTSIPQRPLLAQNVGLPDRRLHYIDWLRFVCIVFAMFLHVWQAVTPESGRDVMLDNAEYPMFEKGSEYWHYVGQDRDGKVWYFWRYVMIGRQIVIPLLFSINGAALSFARDSVASTVKKVGLVTLVGLAINACLWYLGPQDDSCSLTESLKNETKCQGLLLNFVVAPHSGKAFAIVFQFWYTIFLLLILVQDYILFWFLRLLHDRSAEEPPPPVSAKAWAWMAGRLVGISVFWFGLSQWSLGSHQLSAVEVMGVILLEIVFDGLLALSAADGGWHPARVRLFQYLAGITAVLQFTLPNFCIWMDGSVVLFYQVFKQFCMLSFTMHLTRKKAGPALSRMWPVAGPILLYTFTSTNYYRGVMPTYPWFPGTRDRILFVGGSVCWIFVVDRVGHNFHQCGLSEPLPDFIGMGALLAYLWHPVGIALLGPLSLKAFPSNCAPFIAVCVFVLSFGAA